MNNNQYQIRDKVTIIDDLKSMEDEPDFDQNKWCGIGSNMPKYQGQEATITSLIGAPYFRIDIDDGYWKWCPQMIQQNAKPISNRG